MNELISPAVAFWNVPVDLDAALLSERNDGVGWIAADAVEARFRQALPDERENVLAEPSHGVGIGWMVESADEDHIFSLRVASAAAGNFVQVGEDLYVRTRRVVRQ